MRRFAIAVTVALGLATSACVETRQFADLQFTPPQGDYKLLVLRPDVNVAELTAGGMSQPRADWTEQARTNIVAALRAQQAARGGKMLIAERRGSVPGIDPDTVAEIERLNYVVDQSIVLHKYYGMSLPTKRSRGLDYTLGEAAVELGRKTGYVDVGPEHEQLVIALRRSELKVVDIARWFDALLETGAEPKAAANWTASELFGALNRMNRSVADSPVTPAQAGELLNLIGDGTLSGTLAKQVFEIMLETGQSAAAIVDERGLKQTSDTGAIDAAVDQVIAANADKVEQYKGGKEALFGFFVGQVMKAMGGKANPKVVNERLRSKLG